MTTAAQKINWLPGEKAVFASRTKLPPSQWCDEHLQLGKGPAKKWRASKAPAVAKAMDLQAMPSVRKSTTAKGVQIGGTVGLGFGFLAWDTVRNGGDNALVALGDEKAANKLISGKLHPMLKHTEPLQDLGGDKPRAQELSGMELANGTTIYTGWARSINTLSSQDCRVVIKEEFSKWNESVGHGSNASAECDARADTYPDTCKIIELSTQGPKGGPLDQSLAEADVIYRYHVVCPHCGDSHEMTFENFTWPDDATPNQIQREKLAGYACPGCGVVWDDFERDLAVQAGDYVSSDPSVTKPVHIGIIIPGWLSLYNSLSKIVARWLRAQGNKTKLMAWHNLYAAESFEEDQGERADWQEVAKRREKYGPIVPARACVLTCAVDVQDDRLEMEVVAWGKGEESWGIHTEIIWGTMTSVHPWQKLDDFLRRKFKHESGAELPIACTCIDTGGHHTKQAYRFVKNKFHRRIYGVKGSSKHAAPLVGRPTTSNLGKIRLFPVGTNAAKEAIMGRIKDIEKHGPGYTHFPEYYDDEYFKQLCAEKVTRKWKGGAIVAIWEKVRARNEAIDLRVYNEAAIALLNPNYDKLLAALERYADTEAADAPLMNVNKKAAGDESAPTAPVKKQKTRKRLRTGGFVKRR
ncbi:terminase gpA endonuclease subunit [Desulfuromonas acetoxidans]|uniref:terminase gpA endonuclease subunit n=1 Tax=Desulfuromonas acetoxidans TaxID=891 RepID=UPI00292D63E7|nr:terminase gpA endonuclease subunit [Desulfuromonas acetoxidans]